MPNSRNQRVSIYFKKGRLDLLEYLNNKASPNNYICDLIEEERNRENEQNISTQQLLQAITTLTNKIGDMEVKLDVMFEELKETKEELQTYKSGSNQSYHQSKSHVEEIVPDNVSKRDFASLDDF